MSGNKNSKNQVKKLRSLYRKTAHRFGSTYRPRRERCEWVAAEEFRNAAE